MEMRKFGKSMDKITLLGFGCWGIGKSMWIGADDAESKKALIGYLGRMHMWTFLPSGIRKTKSDS